MCYKEKAGFTGDNMEIITIILDKLEKLLDGENDKKLCEQYEKKSIATKNKMSEK